MSNLPQREWSIVDGLYDEIERCDLDKVKYWIGEKGLRADYYGGNGTLLTHAVYAGGMNNGVEVYCSAAMVKYLIEQGADINYVSDIGGDTPLTAAISMQDCESATILLHAGADPTIPCRHFWDGIPSCGENLHKNAIEIYRDILKPRMQEYGNVSAAEKMCWALVEKKLYSYEKEHGSFWRFWIRH